MQSRLDFYNASPAALQAVLGLENYVAKQSGLDPHLIHLLKLRASQINGCAYCVDMHSKEARHSGLSEQWINLVSVWRESPVFDDRERAVLEWTEALTNVADTGAPGEAYEPLKDYFTEKEIMDLTVAISTINVWNRLAVGFRSQHPIDKVRKAS
ncbi:carboxymuconolactone decarboxylase family protein [Sneathiella sp.]|uniref:carboxymuconolactone decarboxylase family protein n=1 Tax=Sneathiella sp. TaxID=1964365 RepID=UPI0026318E7F|nr:carboxymuconolactone decarboxylase family protein [Sneathiella sp.]MDF2368311.1 carboxymuconolactone decarboxylase family protein [Sneathiella sp.]